MEDAAIAHSSLLSTLTGCKAAQLPDTVPDVTALYAVGSSCSCMIAWAGRSYSLVGTIRFENGFSRHLAVISSGVLIPMPTTQR